MFSMRWSWLLVGLLGCSPGTTEIASMGDERGPASSLDAGDAQTPPVTQVGSNDAGEQSAPELGLAPCHAAPDQDSDQDGVRGVDGDCYDCDARINPGAFEVPDNHIDEDCSGADAKAQDYACDEQLMLGSFDPQDGARALGLCTFSSASTKGWGVLSARYVDADGKLALRERLQVGLLPSFGSEKPRAGKSMLVLSSGVARAPDQADASDNCGDYFAYQDHGWPKGYPKPSPACGGSGGGGGSSLVLDPAALELEIRVPTNARGLSFDTNFYTYEYPSYICSQYNDYFLVLMDPAPAGRPDGNIVFDLEGNWISVNNGLLQVCTPGEHQGKTFECKLGPAPLKDTGYDQDDTLCGEGAATGWLHTVVPVTPGSSIRLRFAIWDTNDTNRDSTVLIDNLMWDVDAPTAIETEPVLL